MATARIGLRHDTAANWASENPTIAVDETVLIDDETKLIRGTGDEFNTDYTVIGTLGAADMVNGKYVGELFHFPVLKSASASFPALCLSDINEYSDISSTNWPDLVTEARTWKTAYKLPGASAVDSWSVTVSGSNITFPAGTSDGAVLAALVEDAYYNDRAQGNTGSVDWGHAPTVNVAGTDYVITGINLGTSVVTVTGSPTTGAQTAIFYTHRVAGSATTARMFEATGLAIHSPGDDDGLFVVGRRRRDQMQLIEGTVGNFGVDSTNLKTGAFSSTTTLSGTFVAGTDGLVFGPLDFNSSNSPDARASTTTDGTTHSPALVEHLYIHGGRYAA
jgi:hypothetical protein